MYLYGYQYAHGRGYSTTPSKSFEFKVFDMSSLGVLEKFTPIKDDFFCVVPLPFLLRFGMHYFLP